MQLRYDEDFVEAAVLLCTRGRGPAISPQQLARFNRAREKLYSILDPDERNTAFFELHLEWFREWGLAQRIASVLREFVLLAAELRTLAIRKPCGKNDEGAELYVNESGERTGVLAMRPERLVADPELEAYLRHELTHLQDMMAPAFGYRPRLSLTSLSAHQERLARERYRVLWDVTIDGRISRAGRRTVATRDQRWSEFRCAFPFWAESRQREVFASLWEQCSPTHAQFESLLPDPRQARTSSGPQPGGSCPLCGFPTFAWAEGPKLSEAAAAAVRLEFPSWSVEHGLCGRCFEIYRLKALAPVVAL